MGNQGSIRNKFKVFRIIILSLLMILAGVLLLLFFGLIEDTVTGRGKLEGIREYQIKSGITGKVEFISKREGDSIREGEVLLGLDPRALQDKITMVSNAINDLKSEINAKIENLNILRRDPLPESYRHTEITLAEYRTRFEKSKNDLEIYTKLFQREAISRREFQKVELEHLANQSKLQQLTEDYEKIKSGMAEKIVKKAESELELEKSRLAGKVKELDMLKHQLEDYIIRAPEDGVVSYIPAKPGIYVEAGEMIAKVSATQSKKFVALIDEKLVYKIKEGQQARIISSQYSYFDYGYFYGRVIEIGQLPEKVNGANFYPVKVILTVEPQKLRLGSTGEIMIITGRERIIYSLLGWRR